MEKDLRINEAISLAYAKLDHLKDNFEDSELRKLIEISAKEIYRDLFFREPPEEISQEIIDFNFNSRSN